MILVTTGTNGAPFDRLLRAVDAIDGAQPLIVQHGPSRIRPRGATCVAYLSFDDLVAHIRRAKVVITHGGVGSVVVALMNGRRALVVPRVAGFGEAVDDHQLAFGRKLAEAGLVTLVTDPARLRETLSSRAGERAIPNLPGAGGLAQELRTYLRSIVGETACDPIGDSRVGASLRGVR
jgi:UDP-N-acetylglucosamine transferase subunit ALG13